MIKYNIFRYPPEFSLLLVGYVLNYLFYYYLLGAGFQTYRLLDFSHFLNPEWLRRDLFHSLLYLHSQPPFMNLLIGIVFKIMPEHYEAFFRVFYFIAGAMAMMVIYRTMKILEVHRCIVVGAFAVLYALPTLYMYGTWYFSTHLEFCISAHAFYYLAYYLKQGDRKPLILAKLFICFALLGLIRPQWHLGLFVLGTFGILLLQWFQDWKKILVLSLIFIVPLTSWYAKNLYIFGFFGPSSWMGANIAQGAMRGVLVSDKETKEKINEMLASGVISYGFQRDFKMQFIAQNFPLDHPKKWHRVVRKSIKTKDPDFKNFAQNHREAAYVQYNLNYLGMIESAKMDMRDALTIITTTPLGYVKGVGQQMYEITKTASFLYTSLNLLSARSLIKSWWISDVLPVLEITRYFSLFYYGVIPLAVFLFVWVAAENHLKKFIILTFIFVLFMLLTACALNGLEQERMRWGWASIYLLYAAIFMDTISKKLGNLYGRYTQHARKER